LTLNNRTNDEELSPKQEPFIIGGVILSSAFEFVTKVGNGAWILHEDNPYTYYTDITINFKHLIKVKKS